MQKKDRAQMALSSDELSLNETPNFSKLFYLSVLQMYEVLSKKLCTPQALTASSKLHHYLGKNSVMLMF